MEVVESQHFCILQGPASRFKMQRHTLNYWKKVVNLGKEQRRSWRAVAYPCSDDNDGGTTEKRLDLFFTEDQVSLRF